MRLKLLYEDTTNTFYGYRSYGDRNGMMRVLKNGINVSPNQETYWSWKPTLYYSYGIDGNKIGNIVEVRFLQNDPKAGGFGDGQALYAYLVSANKEWLDEHHSAKANRLLSKLPSELKNALDDLRDQITNDPEWRGDWHLAGILPKHYKNKMIELFKMAREYLSAQETADESEFNYIGPITKFNDPNDTSIVGVYELYKDSGEIFKAYYTSPLSRFP